MGLKNPNIGFKMVNLLLNFYDLDHSIRCNSTEKALSAVSGMIVALRQLRRAIRADMNKLAFIKAKGGKLNAIESH